MNIKVVFSAFISAAAIHFSAFAAESVLVDNMEIQEYNGSVGKWVYVQNYAKLREIVAEFGSDEQSVKSLNPEMKYNSYLFVPYSKDYIAALSSKGIFRREVSSEKEEFIWPIVSINRISSLIGQRWGAYHPGVDLAAVNGTPVVAALDGKVILSKYIDGYGNCVILEHRNGYITKYGHNTAVLVRTGDYVRKGQLLAFSGNTGRSTGPHVHFEVRLNDIPLDPLDFLPEDEATADVVNKIYANKR